MYKLIQQGEDYNKPIHQYICDTLIDLNLIPLSKNIESNIGDKAYIISTSENFIRNGNGIWEKYINEHGGTGDVDQHYNPKSENAQSGKAVAEALTYVKPITRIVPILYTENITLSPNQINDISELIGPVIITLENGAEGYDNEWIFVLNQGEAAYEVSLPLIEWTLGIAPTFAENTITEVRLFYKKNILCGIWL